MFSGTHTRESVLGLSFNENASCFAVGTQNGYRIFSVDPPAEIFRHEEFEGGLSIVEMLESSNILAMVGGGETPHFPQNHVIIWDNMAMDILWELQLKTTVLAVRMQRERILVVLNDRIVHYSVKGDFDEVEVLYEVRTGDNPLGLCAVTREIPGLFASVAPTGKDLLLHQCPDMRERGQVEAHRKNISCIAILDETTVATTSDGKIISVWNSEDWSKTDFHRGSSSATIHCMAIDPSKTWMCAISGNGTLHLFRLSSAQGSTAVDKVHKLRGVHLVDKPIVACTFGTPESGTEALILVLTQLELSYYRVIAGLRPSDVKIELGHGEGGRVLKICE